ncbi:hypothetical protein ACXR0O_06580 [Verrucomicrobiota bacterium sgz303538]
MKRFLPALGFGVVLISVAVVLPLYLAAQREKGGAWQPLPGGGEIRFHTVTHGSTHRVYYPKAGLGELIKRSLQSRSFRPFFEKPGWSETSTGSGQNIAIWLASRGRKGSLSSLSKGELMLPDGQTFYSGSSGSSGGPSREFSLSHMNFQVLPYTAKQLKFATTIDGKHFEWDFPNSAYREDVPEWTPEPLPQTREISGYKVILKDLKLKPSSPYTTNWEISPTSTVFSSDGKDVGKWFSLGYRYCDAGGNDLYKCGLLGASAWKVKVRLSRTNSYPFAEDEVRWIGALGKSSQEAFVSRQFATFPLDEVARERGAVLAGLFGPGQYEINKEGDVVRAGPLVKNEGERVSTTNWLHERNILSVNLEQPAFLFLSGWTRGVSVLRDPSDRPVSLKESWSSGGPIGMLRIYSFPKDAVRFGLANVDLPSPSVPEVEFVVQPPAIPAEKAALPKN